MNMGIMRSAWLGVAFKDEIVTVLTARALPPMAKHERMHPTAVPVSNLFIDHL